MFVPLSQMSAELQAHLRYPEDIFSIQSAIYGRYHLTTPSAFYAASDSWQLSPTAGAGPQSQSLSVVNTYNSQGELISTNPSRMAPLYQVYALPGTNTQAFTITDAYVPASQSNSSGSASGNLNLTAFMVGNSDPGHYGQLNLYETPQGTVGPANADSEIQANNTVSKDITLLDQHGSEVLLGNTLMVPVGQSIVYLRPLYVASSTNPLPQLNYVIGVVGQKVVIESSLAQTLSAVLGTSVSTTVPSSGAGTGPVTSTGGTGTLPAAVQQDLATAQTDYNNALAALKFDQLGTYQTDIAAMETQIANAQASLKSSGTTSSTTTTTSKSTKTKTTTTSKSSKSTKDNSTSTTSKGSETTTTLAAADGSP